MTTKAHRKHTNGRVTAMLGEERLFALDLDLDEALGILEDFDAGGGEVALWQGTQLLAVRMADGKVLRVNRGHTASA